MDRGNFDGGFYLRTNEVSMLKLQDVKKNLQSNGLKFMVEKDSKGFLDVGPSMVDEHIVGDIRIQHKGGESSNNKESR